MRISEEGKRKLKASFANIALFLSIFVVLFPLTLPTVSADGDWFYVGGTGDGNYTFIQDAIDDAYSYDFIYVYSGTYNEKLTIKNDVNHSRDHLTLIGEDRDSTIVQPPPNQPGTVIKIFASWVTVTGFT